MTLVTIANFINNAIEIVTRGRPLKRGDFGDHGDPLLIFKFNLMSECTCVLA